MYYSNLFDKNVLKRTAIEQVNYMKYYFPLIFPDKNCARTLSKHLQKKQSWCILRKWRQNTWRRMWEIVFFLKLQVGISQVLQTQFPGILSKWTPSNGNFSILHKTLEKHLRNSFLLYLVVEILQLVQEIAVCRRCCIKEVF